MTGIFLLHSQEHLENLTEKIEFSLSNRRKPLLIYQSKSYLKIKDGKNGQTYFGCRNRQCNAKGILRGEKFTLSRAHSEECEEKVESSKQNINCIGDNPYEGIYGRGNLEYANKTQIEYKLSNKGHPILVYQEKAYVRGRYGKNGQTYYRCRNTQCLGKGVLREEKFTVTRPHSFDCKGDKSNSNYRKAPGKQIDTNEPNAHNPDLDVPQSSDTSSICTKIQGRKKNYVDVSSEVVYVNSQKGKQFVYHNGYLYKINRINKNSLYHICRKQFCKGKLIQVHSNLIYVFGEHNHLPDEDEYQRLKTMSLLKEEVKKDPTISKIDVYTKVLQQRYQEVDHIERYPSGIPTFNSVRNTMCRHQG